MDVGPIFLLEAFVSARKTCTDNCPKIAFVELEELANLLGNEKCQWPPFCFFELND